jgi:hypothetical protein
MDLPDLVRHAGIEENPLRGRGLPGIDVGHDADIALPLNGYGLGHEKSPLPAVMGAGLVGLGHAVSVFALLHRSAAIV